MINCIVCGESLVNKRSDAKYCSHTCIASAEKRRYRERKGLAVKPIRGPYKVARKTYENKRKRTNEYSKKKYHSSTGLSRVRKEAVALGFKSGFEVIISRQLQKAGVKFQYEPIKIPYTISGEYVPDFLLPNGVIVEAKGLLNKYDDKEAAKMIAVRDQHPEYDIRFVFQDAQTKVPRRKSTHAQWATRNGFLWADGEIPEEWLM